MDDAKQQLADRLKTSNNILVTVSRNPSVDQLASCIGLALFLNKLSKHTAAVFSGQVPSTLEFLQPEETLEQNTDSLRDFIIALDKSKADKLRYKVEDNVVRIFITPYKTSISENDLEFSQGDFNVDVVVALGVAQQEDLDEAITANGRILHDATVASINTSADGGLGTINWHDPQASSLSELVTELAQAVDPKLLDGQIATALLTGIVSATDRFSNDKTSSQTMSASAALMAAGANQQLVASKLEEPEAPSQPDQQDQPDEQGNDTSASQDGIMEIDHNDQDEATESQSSNDDKPANDLNLPEALQPAPADDSAKDQEDVINSELPPDLTLDDDKLNNQLPPATNMSPGPKLVTESPTIGGTMTANSQQQPLDPVTDPMSLPQSELPPMLEHSDSPLTSFTPPPDSWTPPAAPQPAPAIPPGSPPAPPAGTSLSELEAEVKQREAAGLTGARDEVNRALSSDSATRADLPEPIQALNAQPLGDDLHPPDLPVPTPDPSPQTDSNSPPPVPPPIPFQFGNSPQQ